MTAEARSGREAPPIAVEVVRARPPLEPGEAAWRFPPPLGRGTIVVAGGDFEPATIIEGHRSGYFPWPHGDEEYLWFSPDPRAILPPERFYTSRRLARRIRQGRFRVTIDADFPAVIAACADRPTGTWITPGLAAAYRRLHELGWAHSIEVWSLEGVLIGGLYGVAIGGLFVAESKFHRATDASKIALAALVQWCRARGIVLIDVQVLTPHLASLGAMEVPRRAYLDQLRRALALPVRFLPDWSAAAGAQRTTITEG
ncbi:MAG: leucyl/phenylalanyl-tRNA--protein transferase [Chloroflexota bacterium]|nr:leucyl/phenylalanyl-tRNA--protein transferase [Dehalococcoidia bacterium]MDW8047490.1 leucyl/phenylalanyl-tRNA--protein transferase [Chloroflexota bacterium]